MTKTFDGLALVMGHDGYTVWDVDEGRTETNIMDLDEVIKKLPELVEREVVERERKLIMKDLPVSAAFLSMIHDTDLVVTLDSGRLGEFKVLLITDREYLVESRKTGRVYKIVDASIEGWELDPPTFYMHRLV